MSKSIEEAWFRLFLDSIVKPTTTGRIDRINTRSYLSKGPNVDNPVKNLLTSIWMIDGYKVSLESIIAKAIPMISM